MPVLKFPKTSLRLSFSQFPIIAGMMALCFLTGYSINRMSPNQHSSRKLDISNPKKAGASGGRTIEDSTEKKVPIETIFKGSKLRGFHEKSMLGVERISPQLFGARNQIYTRWLERCKKGNCTDHLELGFPTCKAVINHHYKFIWLRGTKVGGTALREPLGWVCDDNFALDGLDVDDTYCGVGLFTNATYDQVVAWWKEYFVFDIIRNPYVRFASGEQYVSPKVRDSCTKTFTFGEVCNRPYVHTQYCLTHPCCRADVEHHYLHMASQSQCLFDPNLNLVVDYLGETETLEEDTEIIINEINKRRNSTLPPLKANLEQRNVHKSKKADPNPRSYALDLYKNNEHCLKSVGKLFERDFFLLGYEKLDKFPDNLSSN